MIVGILQARMGSTRLPGKVLLEVNGRQLLDYQVERVTQSTLLDKFVIATSDLDQDDPISEFCKSRGISCYRGSESDVLKRFYDCALEYNAQTVVRLTGDCPFSDPVIIDNAISFYKDGAFDYACNTVPPATSRFPDGSDVEIFSMKALERAYHECSDKHFREHVTFYFWKNDNDFKTGQLSQTEDWSKYRVTIDYPEDLEVFSLINEELENRESFGHIPEIIEILNSKPEIRELNSNHYFGEGWSK